MGCKGSSESFQLLVKVVAMLNFVFWSLLLIFYGYMFFEAVNVSGSPASRGEDNFFGNFLYVGEREGNLTSWMETVSKDDDEVMFSAALLTNFVVIIIFQIFLSLLLLHAAEKKSLVRTQVWFYMSLLIFGIDIVSHIVAFVLAGAHVFILSKTVLLFYFGFCLCVVYLFIGKLKKELNESMPNRDGSISPPVQLVTPLPRPDHVNPIASFPAKTYPDFPFLVVTPPKL